MIGNRARVALIAAALGSATVAVGGLAPRAAAAASTVYYLHGTAADDANRAEVTAGQAQPTATFDTTAPTSTSPVGVTQTPVVNGNKDQSANALSAYWYGSFKGTASGDLYIDWYWSSRNAEAVALGSALDVTVFADPNPLVATTNTEIAQSTVSISVGATPTLNHSVVPLSTKCPCAVASNLLIQATAHYVDTGNDNAVHYDSTSVPSSFHFDAPESGPQPSTATVTAGTQTFANYGSPAGFQTRDAANRPNSGEPSIGADWTTGKILYMAGTQVSQIGFDTSKNPPAATWSDVTPAQLANASEDSILFTNHDTNRTWAEDFLINPTCNANVAFTDSDGGSGGGATSQTSNTNWTPAQCPTVEGPDHPSMGAGPYHGAPPVTALDTKEIVYYCSQNVLTIAGAECTHSENGGLTWDAPARIFGTGSPCDSIHGHIRVSPDGTMYVPQGNCGGKQGMAVTQDNGSTYTYAVVPDSVTGPTDPSVAADKNNTIYFGYQAGATSSQPMIAVSSDHGAHWNASVNVGKPFGIQNAVFPEVIAGDPGRAAYAFLGTTTPGDYQQETFSGVWYLYVAFTYDGGSSWQVVNATPNDPVQRGCVDNGGATGGTYVGCRNMLDFNDITTDKQGNVYVAYTDGCTTDPSNTYSCDKNPAIVDTGCATTPGGQTYSEGASEYSTATCTYGRQAALVRQTSGDLLYAAPSASTPESPVVFGLVGAGGLAIGVAVLGARRRRRASAGAPSGLS